MPLVRLSAFTARLVLLPCLLLATACGIAHAQPRMYALDPVHTRIVLAIDHAGFSKALGTVSGSTGTLQFDPADWSSAQVEVEIPLARLDFGDDAWNRAALARNLLDAEEHPVARFVSTRVEPVDAARAVVHGTLTLRGVSRDVALDVTLNAAKRHPLPPFRQTVGFSASTTLSRADFGITAWKSVIGDQVELRIEAEATRTRAADPSDRERDAVPAKDAAPPAASEPADAPTDAAPDIPPQPSPAPAKEDTPP